MISRTNLAYKGNALSRERQEKLHIGKIKARKARQEKPFLAISLILIISGLFAFLIFSMVKMNEITTNISMLEKEYRLQQSEHIRLNSEIESQINYSSIEEYAKNKWGMQKQSGSQVNYINISQGNLIEVDSENNKNMLDGLVDSINNIFS